VAKFNLAVDIPQLRRSHSGPSGKEGRNLSLASLFIGEVFKRLLGGFVTAHESADEDREMSEVAAPRLYSS